MASQVKCTHVGLLFGTCIYQPRAWWNRRSLRLDTIQVLSPLHAFLSVLSQFADQLTFLHLSTSNYFALKSCLLSCHEGLPALPFLPFVHFLLALSVFNACLRHQLTDDEFLTPKKQNTFGLVLGLKETGSCNCIFR